MSLKARLDAAFNQFTVAKRAEETTRALNDYSNQPKEIHSHFTELVDRIFTSSGWGMHDLTLQNKKDFEAIMTFLGPTGVFLNVINKLQLDPFLRYTMPTIVSQNGVVQKETPIRGVQWDTVHYIGGMDSLLKQNRLAILMKLQRCFDLQLLQNQLLISVSEIVAPAEG